MIELAKYQVIDHELTFEATDLSGATFLIREAKPAVLQSMNFELLQATLPARVRMYGTRQISEQLAEGGGNWFILEVILPDGGNIALPKIGIKVT